MRKITLGLAVSLDGFIEGPNGEYDWCFTDNDYGMTEFLAGIDTIFYGRKSFATMEKHGGPEKFWKDKKHFVFSNKLTEIAKPYKLINGDVRAEVNKIKQSEGADIWLFGGSALASSFINLGLLDAVWLSVHPILLGRGTPLFSNLHERQQLSLTHVKHYESGLVSLTYNVHSGRPSNTTQIAE